jgi:hypothetical protein
MNRRRLNAAAAKTLRLAVMTNHPPGPERSRLLALVRFIVAETAPKARRTRPRRVGVV